MKRKHFFAKIDEKQIAAAITQAERKTSGQIRVFVSHHRCPDPMLIACKHFHRLGMAPSHHRNGILIFVAPESQTFALVGDAGIHDKCGDTFWQALRDEMVPEFKAERYTEGIVHAIRRAGELLATHFPDQSENSSKKA
jgi:uncharacterized membrane protein